MYAAFPDWKFEILELAASGKNAACRWRSTGTFDGPGRFQGLAPTGDRVVMEGCDMLRVEDGQIVENNAYTNGVLIAQQLGLLPPAGHDRRPGDDRRLQREDRSGRRGPQVPRALAALTTLNRSRAGVGSVPAASVARTRKRCCPRSSRAICLGDSHLFHLPSST